MPQVNLFLLLPETEPSNQWMRSTEADFSETDAYNTLVEDLEKIICESIAIEKYEGFYDSSNINNFLCLYVTLEDCYPSGPKRILQRLIFRNAFINWREEAIQSPDTDYQIFNQSLNDNTFCEIAERKNRSSEDNYALLNHHACTINSMIVVNINRESAIEIDNLRNSTEISEWFAQNRLPPRNFNINPKHGENIQNIRIVNGEKISPLRCSGQRAQTLLNTAIGKSERELYNTDPDHDEIIVFKYEGPTPRICTMAIMYPKIAEKFLMILEKDCVNVLKDEKSTVTVTMCLYKERRI